jgi:hypothetical protein
MAREPVALTLTTAGLAARLPEAKGTQGATVASLSVVLPKGAGPVLQNIAALLARQVQQRSSAKVELGGAAALRVELAIEPGIGREGFKISDGPDATLRITGNDPRGVLYGVGKFLHTSRYSEAGFTPGAKIILSTWLFDPKEWNGLHEKFRNKSDWCDVLMSDGTLSEETNR